MSVTALLARLQLETRDTGVVAATSKTPTGRATRRPPTPRDRFLERFHPSLVAAPRSPPVAATPLPSYMRLTENLMTIDGDDFNPGDTAQIVRALTGVVITTLVIDNASNLDPGRIVGLFPCVNRLQLRNVSADLDCSGYAHLRNLKTLYIDGATANLNGLDRLPSVETYQFNDCFFKDIPRLNPRTRSLTIIRCNELTSLFTEYPNLNTLKIQNLEKVRYVRVYNTTNLSLIQISDCNDLVSFKGPFSRRCRTASMQSLHISSCRSLEYISTETFPRDLKTLEIDNCASLMAIGSFTRFRSLLNLRIANLPALLSRPKGLYQCEELLTIIFSRCPEAVKLPRKGWFPSIEIYQLD